jgi:hypothetical protein
MGSVDDHHAGVASGVNNAVSRAAGLLAIAALGVVLRKRFDGVLDAKLSALDLSAEVAARVATERSKLGGADVSDLASPVATVLHDTLAHAFVAGFRLTMLVCAFLAALSAATALLLIRTEAPRSS